MSLSPLLHSSIYCTLQKPIQERQIKCCGSQQVLVGLMWRVITFHYSLDSLVYFLGRVSGRWKLHLVLLSSLGGQLWAKSSRLIISRGGVFTLVNWCCLCKKREETVNHLLIHCEFTSEIWHMVLTLFEVLWAMPSNILELLYYWKTQGWGQSKEAIWKVIPPLLMWSILRKKLASIWGSWV
jgi:hypothetical protein